MTNRFYRCASVVAGLDRPILEATTKSKSTNGFYRCASAVAARHRPVAEATTTPKLKMKALARKAGAGPVKLTRRPAVPDLNSRQATAAASPFAASRMTFATAP